MSIIRQLAKNDHHKDQDEQTSCTRSSVSSPKNDKNLIQEANSKYFNYFNSIDWLLVFWVVKCFGLECVQESALGIFIENFWINKTAFVAFINCLAQQSETRLDNTECGL